MNWKRPVIEVIVIVENLIERSDSLQLENEKLVRNIVEHMKRMLYRLART